MSPGEDGSVVTQRETCNDERGEVRDRDALGVMLAVAALLLPSGYYLVPAILNDACTRGPTAGCERAGIRDLRHPDLGNSVVMRSRTTPTRISPNSTPLLHYLRRASTTRARSRSNGAHRCPLSPSSTTWC